MFTRRIPLFTLFGFEVKMDLTWLILGALIVWSLAAGLFPALYPDFSRATYWWMGIVGAIGLLFSIVVHELSHSLVARRFDMPISGITLFIFGGVAEMSEEPTGPRAEFLTAVVGPITSLAVAGLFYLLTAVGMATGWPAPVTGTLNYLALLNLLLGVFNMVPAFPLDGGRVLRAVLWGWKGRYRWATRIASNFGSGFGLLLIVLAFVSVLNGNFIGGIWWFLIGMFVRGAAHMTYQQAVVRQVLSGVTAGRLMTKDPVTVPPDLTVDELVDDFFYRHYHKTFPVTEDGRLLGCVDLRDVRRVERDRWRDATVEQIMQKCDDGNTMRPDTDAAKALRTMSESGRSRTMVAEDGKLIGILSRSDIMRFLTIRTDIEEEEDIVMADQNASVSGGMQPKR